MYTRYTRYTHTHKREERERRECGGGYRCQRVKVRDTLSASRYENPISPSYFAREGVRDCVCVSRENGEKRQG
jgi:hypothetical protein